MPIFRLNSPFGDLTQKRVPPAGSRPGAEARIPWLPTGETPDDVLAVFDTISHRLHGIAESVAADDDGPDGEPDDDRPRAA